MLFGIEFINAKGYRADFHSLRHTLATNLARAGTAPRVAMEIMRHSDMRLTSKPIPMLDYCRWLMPFLSCLP
jgi:integrase